MIEALWSVEFLANTQRIGSGVAVARKGKVLGGDAQYFYVGAYTIKDGVLNATVELTHYSGSPMMVFGAGENASIDVSGPIGHGGFMLQGHVVGRSELQIMARFTRRAELS